MTLPGSCSYTSQWHLPVSLATTLCNLISSIGCFYFIFSIVSKKCTRNNTFNLYVVFLILPDGMNTFATTTLGVIRALRCGRSIPDWYGSVYDFNSFFFYYSNFYLNCCVAYELYSIVEGAHRMKKIKPPKMRRLFIQVGCVYSMSILFALWGVLDVPWSFYDSSSDSFGSPQGEGPFSETAAIAFIGALSLFPILFVVAIRIQIWRKKLMPNEGRTRTMYLFFERITIVFIAMYLPCVSLNIVFVLLEPGGNSYYWTERAIHMIKALQASITLYIVAFKHDIRKAVTCSCFSTDDTNDDVEMAIGQSNNFQNSFTARSSYFSESLRFSVVPFRGIGSLWTPTNNESSNKSSTATLATSMATAAEACTEIKQETQPIDSQQCSINHTGLVPNDGCVRDDGKPRDADNDVSSNVLGETTMIET